MSPSPGAGLYIHVPFCVRKCAYCAFFSVPSPPSPVRSSDPVSTWLRGIEREAATLPAGFSPSTVFIGGGTPTALPDDAFARLLDSVAGRWGGPGILEWTVEANPGTLTPGKLRRMRASGVTRLSLGAQSFSPGVLAALGRIHSPAQIRDAVSMARDAGIQNLSLDLMYGWAAPTVRDALDSLRADLDAALALAPDHLSAYCLEVEPGTPLAARRDAGDAVAAPPSLQRRAYDLIRRHLAAAGYSHYELSNFALPGRECRHNLLYWTGGAYIGLGPAAHSHWDGERRANSPTLPDWAVAFRETLPPRRKACETLVMGLRRTAGWTRGGFRAATGFDWLDLRGPEIDRLASDGLLLLSPDAIRLSPSAYFLSDSVFSALV
jgi:oxygen-independent coproporphyrinogen-3 oxidase